MKDNKKKMDISVRDYMSIFNSIPIPAYIWKVENDEFRLVDYNKATELITEGKISNHIGAELITLYDKDTEVFNDIRKCFYQKLDFSKEILYTHKSTGKKKVIHASFNFLHPNFVIFYTVDITKQKEVEKTEEKLKQSEEKYRLISENINDLISVFDTKFKFEYINEKIHTKLMGYTKEDLIGTNGINLIHPDDREFVLQQLTKTIKAGKGFAEARIRHKEGHYVWTETNATTFFDSNNRLKILLLTRDITERKNAQILVENSEKKFREAFNRSNFYKDIFAHDINNIFQNIQSSAELLYLMLNDMNISKGDEFIQIIKEQIIRGSNLISSIRKLSEIEEIESHLKKIELNEVLYNVKDYIIKSFYSKKIDIDIQSKYQKIYLNANELLEDIIENILINGIRYNNSSIIELHIKVSKERSNGKNFIKIEFRDNGIGIPDDMKEKIFQRGYDQKGIIKGLGLGLTLVKKIIAVYGGQIWVEDKVKGDYSKGSKFIILLPEVD